MRHRVRGRKLNRNSAHRTALQRNLTRSLFLSFGAKDHIITTKEKAKFAQPFAEKLITLAKEKTLHNYRRGIQLLRDESAVKTLFDKIAPIYKERPGGYTRVIGIGRRRLGDRASQVLFGFVQSVPAEAASQEAAVVDE